MNCSGHGMLGRLPVLAAITAVALTLLCSCSAKVQGSPTTAATVTSAVAPASSADASDDTSIAPPTSPDAVTTSQEPPAHFAVTGHALSSDGAPVPGVLVGFRRDGDNSGAGFTATTDSSGAYQLDLPAATYVGQCLSSGGECTITTTSGAATTFELSQNTVLDIVVQTEVEPTPPPPPPTPPPAAAFNGFTGIVTTPDGQPVEGAWVEFASVPDCPGVCYQPHSYTDANGEYAVELPAGEAIYRALCGVDNFDYDCGPQGSDGNGPTIVHMPEDAGQMNFIVCLLEEAPACFQS